MAGGTGVRLTFVDHGPGIADIEQAMTDGYTTGGGLGLGLAGAKCLRTNLPSRLRQATAPWWPLGGATFASGSGSVAMSTMAYAETEAVLKL